MTGCIYCKVKNVCLECDVGYVLTNNKCHSTCVSGTGYWSTDNKKCVSDCDAEDFGRKINAEKTKCVDACETDSVVMMQPIINVMHRVCDLWRT